MAMDGWTSALMYSVINEQVGSLSHIWIIGGFRMKVGQLLVNLCEIVILGHCQIFWCSY